MDFNQSHGKRAISDKTVEKLKFYMERMIDKKIIFKNYNFNELFVKRFPTINDFVYFDPPYIQTEAGYNSIWSKKMENDLFDLMKKLTNNNIKFAYSNVSIYKGVENPNMHIFKEYNIIELDHSYEKVARNKGGDNQEILITNYDNTTSN
jgi:site-specific DNA-adenine methylase